MSSLPRVGRPSRARRMRKPRDGARATVYLHVGTPKSGTSYLQALMWQNRRMLRGRGLLYPGWRAEFRGGHHRAALELVRLGNGSLGPDDLRAWPALVAEVRRWGGDAVVSHELLSFAGPAGVERIVTDMGDWDVRVVVTARDLMRVIPSWWQEECRNGRRHTYGEFLRTIRSTPPTGPGAWFARFADLPALVSRFRDVCPPDRVVVVVNGPPGSPAERLPEAFLAALGTTMDGLTTPGGATYPALSVPAAELLRRINAGPLRHMTHDDYQRLVKGPLGHAVLDSLQGRGPRLTVPPEHREWVVQRSLEIVEALVGLGVSVRGDLADLVPRLTGEPFVDPASLTETVLLEWAMDALVSQAIGESGTAGLVGSLRSRSRHAVRRLLG